MERKIGEIFEYNGEWYQCLEQPKKYDKTVCALCAFQGNGNCELDRCSGTYRSDKKFVIFKKLERVGEPYPNAGKLYQLYKLPMNIEKLPPHTEGINLVRFDMVEIELRQTKEDMEKKNMETSNLKPFNLEAAKSGKPVCTRDGRKARIICFDRKDIKPIVALVTIVNGTSVTEKAFYYFEEGHHLSKNYNDINDLMMLPEKKEGWVNVYKETTGEYYLDKIIHKTEKFASDVSCPDNYIGTVKISWEE